MKIGYLYCTFCLLFFPINCYLFAIENSELQNPISTSAISWTWDVPKDIFAEYSIVKSPYWSDAKCPIGGGFRYVHLRNFDNRDEFHLGGYGYLRPLAITLSDSIIIMGFYAAFDTTWVDGHTFFDMDNQNDLINSKSFPLSIGFTMKWSLPKYNVQMEFEVGHYWNRIEIEDDDFQFTIPQAPGLLLNGTLKKLQKETGISLYFGFSWLSNRNFLSGIELHLSGSHPSGTKEVTMEISKTSPISLPDISLDSNPTRTGTFIGLLYITIVLQISIKTKLKIKNDNQ